MNLTVYYIKVTSIKNNFNFVQDLIPEDPPENPENWDTIMDDVEKKIMVGVSRNFPRSSLFIYFFAKVFVNPDWSPNLVFRKIVKAA